jgi:hypothetical protein
MRAENGLERAFRIIVGILLLMQTAVLLMISSFTSLFLPLLGGMAMIVGGGNASDDQVTKTWWMIGLMMVAPFVVTALIGIASIQILERKRPLLISIICGVSVITYLSLAHVVLSGDWTS